MRFARLYALGLTGFQGFSPGVDDNTSQREREAIEAARAKRDGILRGLAFIQAHARKPSTFPFWVDKTRDEILRLEEICRSDSR